MQKMQKPLTVRQRTFSSLKVPNYRLYMTQCREVKAERKIAS